MIMEQKKKRIFMSIFGVFVCGISVAFFKMAALGVDPFQSFMSGLDTLIPISFGTLYMIVNMLLLLFSLVADRHYIGFATFINLFLLGYVVEYSHKFLRTVFPNLQMPGRILFFAVGIVILCLASSFYMTADLGVSTYDAISLIAANTWHIWKFRYCRITSDIICVILGVALYLLAGGEVSKTAEIAGIGTIVTAFFMGPLIEFFNIHVAQPFLKKSNEN